MTEGELYRVVFRHGPVAGFVLHRGRVVRCAPYLKRMLTHYRWDRPDDALARFKRDYGVEIQRIPTEQEAPR